MEDHPTLPCVLPRGTFLVEGAGAAQGLELPKVEEHAATVLVRHVAVHLGERLGEPDRRQAPIVWSIEASGLPAAVAAAWGLGQCLQPLEGGRRGRLQEMLQQFPGGEGGPGLRLTVRPIVWNGSQTPGHKRRPR
jgi:hypothetical protein